MKAMTLKTMKVLGLSLFAVIFFTSCAHDSRGPSSTNEEKATGTFHQQRSASFKN